MTKPRRNISPGDANVAVGAKEWKRRGVIHPRVFEEWGLTTLAALQMPTETELMRIPQMGRLKVGVVKIYLAEPGRHRRLRQPQESFAARALTVYGSIGQVPLPIALCAADVCRLRYLMMDRWPTLGDLVRQSPQEVIAVVMSSFRSNEGEFAEVTRQELVRYVKWLRAQGVWAGLNS